MKFFGKSLFFLTTIGLSCFSLEAKSLTLVFEKSVRENQPFNESSDDLPFQHSCSTMVIENDGRNALHCFLPTSNDMSIVSYDGLAQLLAKEKQPLLTLLNFWQKRIAINPAPRYHWNNPSILDYLNFIGSCPQEEYQKRFIQLCHQLGIDTRQVSAQGKTLYDFNCKDEEWSFLDVLSGKFYLGWDNQTLISSEAMMDDPLLVLRTKSGNKAEKENFKDAWLDFARLEVINPQDIDDDLTFLPEEMPETGGFDLYPKEKLIYSYSKVNSDQVIVSQILNGKERNIGQNTTYHSPFPIREIHNRTMKPLYLKDQQVVVNPLSCYCFDKQKVFTLQIQSQADLGEIIIDSICSSSLFPDLKNGLNTIHLGVQNNPSTIRVEYHFKDSDSLKMPKPSVSIQSSTERFENSPHFALSTDATPVQKVWWQISMDPHFNLVPPNFEQIQAFTSVLTFSPITETFFSQDETYYIRVKGANEQEWGLWSDPVAFSVKKPAPVTLVEFDQIDENQFLLDWTREAEFSEDPIEYLIFGSNAYDFIPSIYTTLQANQIVDGHLIGKEKVDNLVAITTETKLTVDGTWAYYRIVAKQNGQLSVPSPIIHVYGNHLVQPRTVLQMVEIAPNKWVAKRVLFPPSYPWTESALPRLGVKNRLYQDSLLKLKEMILKAKNPSTSSDSSSSESSSSSSVTGFVRPAHVSVELWERMRPYFLPENHPWKKKIDRIFTKSRASQNPDTMRKAGFKGRITGVRRIFAGTHPECPECFFKIYLDSEHTRYIEWQKWIDRITGKNRVKECIKKYGFEKWFTTPDKWVYPLPEKPACSKSASYRPKNFILCCSNQRPYEHSENEKMWKNRLSRQHLDALYIVIDEPGMWDSVFAFNIPFCKVDGKMSFVDTEYSHKWPIRFEKLNRYLSSENVKYWEYLIKHNGPKGYKSPYPRN